MANQPPDTERSAAAHLLVEQVARTAYGRLLSLLSVRSGDLVAAEDALAEALVQALEQWPVAGLPERPEAWLLTVARRRQIDAHRRHQRWESPDRLDLLAIAEQPAESYDPFPDERLRLLFTCAHPALDPAIHTPLMLQAVLGLDAQRIARAMVIPAATLSQRLVRAKARIRDAGLRFELPEPPRWAERLDAVGDAIYAAYTSGWDDVGNTDPARRNLADAALTLARMLVSLMPAEPEPRGLLALILLCESRRAARRTANGRFIPLGAQDPTLWAEALINEAEQHLALAFRSGRPGRFQLEATIQTVHAARRHSGVTDWNRLIVLYRGLAALAPTLGAWLGLAAVLGEGGKQAEGLAILAALPHTEVELHQPYWAVLAHLKRQADGPQAALAAFDRAIELSPDPTIRDHLRSQRDASARDTLSDGR